MIKVNGMPVLLTRNENCCMFDWWIGWLVDCLVDWWVG